MGRPYYPLGCQLDVCCFVDNYRILAAKLQRDGREMLGGCFEDAARDAATSSAVGDKARSPL
jgi:hypothetical protein